MKISSPLFDKNPDKASPVEFAGAVSFVVGCIIAIIALVVLSFVYLGAYALPIWITAAILFGVSQGAVKIEYKKAETNETE